MLQSASSQSKPPTEEPDVERLPLLPARMNLASRRKRSTALLLGLALKHVGKGQPVFQELTVHFVSQGSPCERLLAEVQMQPVKQLHSDLLTCKGEWEVVSHDANDATYWPGEDGSARPFWAN